jgi:hypothetical protein
MNELILFASTFALVFALGLQSLNVNGGHYRAAFVTSFLIGAAQMVLLKLGPDANVTEIAAYLIGGPFGIVCSMCVHRRTIGRKQLHIHQHTHITKVTKRHVAGPPPDRDPPTTHP